MVHGEHKASAYSLRYTGDGYRVEEEYRQCCHCQYVWVYRPGSGIRRGYCHKHDGWLCGRDACIDEQKRLVADYERVTGKTVSCLAHEEKNDFLAEQLAKLTGIPLTVTESGLLIPTTMPQKVINVF